MTATSATATVTGERGARQERARQIKAWALEVGFDRAGVAELRPSDHRAPFERWLARGDHASMAYMGRRAEERLDPRRLLADSRSVVCVALHYYPLRGESEPAGDLWPKVARYARGDDYHRVVEDRLDALAERVAQGYPGTRARRYVDTGPVLERELAQRAGLGRIGKHTNLLGRRGSWFLLGELLLTLDLEPDEPLGDLCGRCTRCLDACPTGALPEPYRLDSRRCLSYWTIEHRGAIPERIRPWFSDWVFGCDLCQAACPWNDKSEEHDHPPFRVNRAREALDLAGLLGMARDEYLERFRRSPLKRAKLSGLKRNAALVIGNRRRPDDIPLLITALDDPDPVLRGHVAWALGRIAGTPAGESSDEAARALRFALVRETKAEVRSEILSALRGFEAPGRAAAARIAGAGALVARPAGPSHPRSG